MAKNDPTPEIERYDTITLWYGVLNLICYRITPKTQTQADLIFLIK